MKKIIITLANLLILTSIFAQTPQRMSYQAVVRNANNQLVTNTTVGIEINILQGSATGTQVYTETQTPATNANGLLTIEIGRQTGFDTISWANGPYFLETKIDPQGGSTYTITGTSQLLTVPYALHAKTAESITGNINETDPVYTNSQAANITATDITNLSNLSGVNTGDQDISGIVTNKQAIQDTASQIRANIPDVSGFITTETDPVYTAWNKSYNDLTNKPSIIDTVNTVLDTTTQFVRTENQNLADVLNLNNDGNEIQIKNIANPTDNQDVATKAYVDAMMDIMENNDFIFVDFTSNKITVLVNNSVAFTDQSKINPTTWLWDFGDGYTSTEQNPTHTYTVAGTYTVSLTASNDILSIKKIKTEYITVRTTLQIGDYYEGGIIFYLSSGQHGLVCATNDLATNDGAEWGCQGTAVNGANSVSGEQNTIDIVNRCHTIGIAAEICSSLTLNGFDDWFLPSIDELEDMWNARNQINNTITSVGGDPIDYRYYWSSTQGEGDYAYDWAYLIHIGTIMTGSKSILFTVRAVRAF